MEDWQLLQNYVERNSDGAFRTLLHRYVDLVHSSALRQLNNDSQLAEEVTQAVFILLARKAREFRQDIILSAWLFRTTRFVAIRALRSEKRRQQREQEAFHMQTLSAPDETWKRVSPLLDEGLDELGEKDRSAILLRFLQNKPLREVGTAMGISEDAAKKRVLRAVEKLRLFFEKRGFKISAAALTACLASQAIQAAPTALAGTLATRVLADASIASASLPVLVKETLSAWQWAKWKLAGFITATVVGTLIVVSSLVSQRTPDSQHSNAPSIPAAAANIPSFASSEGSSSRNATEAKSTNTFFFHVVDAVNNRPIPEARVHIRFWHNWTIDRLEGLTTDDVGQCAIPLPESQLGRLDVGIMAEGYAVRFFNWWPGYFGPLPQEYTLKLTPTQRSFGGWVQDEHGEPISDASVFFEYRIGNSSSREREKEHDGMIEGAPVTASDVNGYWRSQIVPETYPPASISILHPQYGSNVFYIIPSETGKLGADEVRQLDLFAGKAVLVLKPQRVFTGRVIDENRQPIVRPTVCYGRYGQPSVTGDENGNFALPEKAAFLTASAEGFQPVRMELSKTNLHVPLEIILKPGFTVRYRALDENDLPVEKARVGLEDWDGDTSLAWAGNTDQDGKVEWRGAPSPDDLLHFYAYKDGFMYSRENETVADGKERTIRMHRLVTISGKVVDAETKEPVARFKAIPGYSELASSTASWYRDSLAHGTNGDYKVTFNEMKPNLRVRIEAEGYESEISPMLPLKHGQTQNFALKKETEIHGVIFLPDGRPAAGAEVVICSIVKGPTGAMLIGTAFDERTKKTRNVFVQTGADGRFTFKSQRFAHTLLVVHDAGFTRMRLSPGSGELSVQLEPWGRIEGTIPPGMKPENKLRVKLSDWASAQYVGGLELDNKFFSAAIDESGRFVIEKVPAGHFDLWLDHGYNFSYGTTHHVPVKIEPGQTLQVQFSSGIQIAGRFTTEDSTVTITNWQKQVHHAVLSHVSVPRRPTPDGLSEEDQKLWEVDYYQSDAGRERMFASRTIGLVVEPNGSFHMNDVISPGEYRLHAVIRKTSDFSSPVIGNVSGQVQIPEWTEGGQTIDLGGFTMKKATPRNAKKR